MQRKRILVIGYGKLGSRVAQELSQDHQVIVIKRSKVENEHNLTMCYADITQSKSLENICQQNFADIDYLIYCLSPSERTEEGYRDAYVTGLKNVMSCLPKLNTLKQLIFISSTSVYHQAKGEAVDETSACLPSTFSGKILLEAEAYIARLNVASTTIRFSGIYGRTRSRLIYQVEQALQNGEVLSASPGYTNRIHEDDCVGFICHLIGLLEQDKQLEACYIGTDSCPVEQVKVYQFIAKKLLSSSKEFKGSSVFKIEEASSAKSSRRAGSKQCMNKRMIQSGYQLKFDSYKEGYLESLSKN